MLLRLIGSMVFPRQYSALSGTVLAFSQFPCRPSARRRSGESDESRENLLYALYSHRPTFVQERAIPAQSLCMHRTVALMIKTLNALKTAIVLRRVYGYPIAVFAWRTCSAMALNPAGIDLPRRR